MKKIMGLSNSEMTMPGIKRRDHDSLSSVLLTRILIFVLINNAPLLEIVKDPEMIFSFHSK